MFKKKCNVGFLYFILPIFFFLLIDFSRERDIWFLFSHGKYVLNNGFPHTEFLTIHKGLHFVMQQWAFSTIMYFIYQKIGSIGIVLFVGFINFLIVFFLYKLCLTIGKNKYLSCLIVAVIDLLLELTFIIPRPQIITMLFLIITLYLLERKDKSVFFLPLISLLQINFHASMWPMLFIICLPYLVEYLVHKDKTIINLIITIIISLLVGFLNPYGLEAMTYSFSSYGVPTINKAIIEMQHISLTSNPIVIKNTIIFLMAFITSTIFFIIYRRKYSLHTFLLLIGISFMSFLNIRNIFLFMIIILPFLTALPFFKSFKKEISFIPILIIIITIIGIGIFKGLNNDYELRDEKMEKALRYLDNHKTNNMILYTDFNYGSYFEYYGYKSYIDGRAEVFLKKNNHKEDIFVEYYHVLYGSINYHKFLNKYHFTHIVVSPNYKLNKYLKNNKDYCLAYKDKYAVIYRSIKYNVD